MPDPGAMTACVATRRAVTGDGYKQLCTCGSRLRLPRPGDFVFRRALGGLLSYVREVADDHDQSVDIEIVAPPFDRIGVWMGARVHPNATVDARLSPWPMSDDPRCPGVERGAVAARLVRDGWALPRHLDSHHLRNGDGAITQRFAADLPGGRIAYHFLICHNALFPAAARAPWEARAYLIDAGGDDDRCLPWT